MSMTLKVEGLEELQDSFEKVIRQFPDDAGNELRKLGLQIKKDAISNTKARTASNPKHKQSLLRNYGVSQVRGTYLDQEVDITTSSPHFHLVEDGHEQVMPYKIMGHPYSRGGEHVGRVQGFDMLKDAIEKNEDEMPKNMEKMVDKILKKNGF
jgi:hypothetical protein